MKPRVNYINYNGNLLPEKKNPFSEEKNPFRFRNGLLESMLVIRGKVPLLEFHAERLTKSMEQLRMPFPAYFNQSFLEQEIAKILRANPPAAFHRLRLQLGVADSGVSFYLEAVAVQQAVFAFNKKGWEAGFSDAFLKDFSNKGNIKQIHPELYRTGRAIARQNGWDDILLTNKKQVIESSIANIFLIKNQVVFTPPLSAGCVDGVMRKWILKMLSGKYPVQEKTLTIPEVLEADEVFLTNAIRRIKWIGKIGNRYYSDSSVRKIYLDLFPGEE